jgi:hypothetical protein
VVEVLDVRLLLTWCPFEVPCEHGGSVRSRMAPGPWVDLAGVATVRLPSGGRTTVWRAGRRAGALAASLHAGSGTCAAWWLFVRA